MFKLGSTCLVAGVLFASGGARAGELPDNQVIPNFAPTAKTGWVLDHAVGVDDLLPPPTGGPGPVTFDKAHPYVPNGGNTPSTYRVADLTNPILLPWTIPSMKKANDDVLAGKVPFAHANAAGRSACQGSTLIRWSSRSTSTRRRTKSW
jgi:hypothetical protein